MDYFTQTVDVTLLSSRAYDDSAYDLDNVAAEKGRRAVKLDLNEEPVSGCLLIIGTPGLGWGFLRTFFAIDDLGKKPSGTIQDEENRKGEVYLLESGKIVLVGLPKKIDVEQTFAWAEATVGGPLGQGSGRILVFGSMGLWRYAERTEVGEEMDVRRGWLGSCGAAGMVGSRLLMTMLDGVMAAMLSEAQFQELKAVAYVGFHDGISADPDCFLSLEEPLCKELATFAPQVIPQDTGNLGRYVEVSRKAIDSEKLGIYS